MTLALETPPLKSVPAVTAPQSSSRNSTPVTTSRSSRNVASSWTRNSRSRSSHNFTTFALPRFLSFSCCAVGLFLSALFDPYIVPFLGTLLMIFFYTFKQRTDVKYLPPELLYFCMIFMRVLSLFLANELEDFLQLTLMNFSFSCSVYGFFLLFSCSKVNRKVIFGTTEPHNFSCFQNSLIFCGVFAVIFVTFYLSSPYWTDLVMPFFRLFVVADVVIFSCIALCILFDRCCKSFEWFAVAVVLCGPVVCMFICFLVYSEHKYVILLEYVAFLRSLVSSAFIGYLYHQSGKYTNRTVFVVIYSVICSLTILPIFGPWNIVFLFLLLLLTISDLPHCSSLTQ
ncbi:hypothetical protein P9112_011009 [Eukaryota sp. TZLM1-RC]